MFCRVNSCRFKRDIQRENRQRADSQSRYHYFVLSEVIVSIMRWL